MNSLYRVVFGIKIIAIFVVATLSSCTNKPSDSIRIGILDGPSAVSFIQLIDQPPVIEGKKVEIIIKSEPVQIQAMMMQGELDFAILPTVMAANLYNKGVNYHMVACPIWGTLYLLTKGTARDIKDLKNATISVFGQGATADILLRHTLQQKGVENVKIDYTYATNNEISQALRFRKVQVAVVSEPLVSTLLAQDSSIRIISKLECEYSTKNISKNTFVQTSFLVSDRFSADNPALVSKVCEAYSKSCNFTSEYPEKAVNLMVKHKFSLNLAVARQSLRLCSIRYVNASDLEEELYRYLNIFYEYNPKSIGGKLPEKDFIYKPKTPKGGFK